MRILFIITRIVVCLLVALTVAQKILVDASTSTAIPKQRSYQREGSAASSGTINNNSNRSRVDRDRGWPMWFPRDFNSNSSSRAPKSDRDRGWPFWFPRNLNGNSSTATIIVSEPPPALRVPSNTTKSKEDRKGALALTTNKTSTSAVETRSSSTKGQEEKTDTNTTATSNTRMPPLFFRRQRQQQSEILIVVKNNSNNEVSYDVKKNETTTETTTTTSEEAPHPPTKDGATLLENEEEEGVVVVAPNTSTTANTTNTNQTQVSPQASSSPPVVQPQGPGLIVLGAPNAPYRIYRRPGSTGPVLSGIGGPVAVEPFPPSAPGRGAGGLPQQPTNNGVLLVELAASVLGTLTRLWLLRSITSWLAKQEESMQPTQHFVWERLNDKFVRDAGALKTAIQTPPDGVSASKWKRIQNRQQKGQRPPRKQLLDLTATFQRTVVVVELTSETKDGPDNDYLSDIISFLVQQHRRHSFGTNKTTLEPAELEVVFLVQSPGGSVASFGLAAAQLQRLAREQGIVTTVCVDKYAASGGYMIASQAHRLIAAPFASVGSVGVIMEGLNFNEIARKYGVQPLVIKAGESKNPITTFGAISRQDLDHQKEQLDKVHDAFKDLILQGRPFLKDKLGKVADGNVFLGQEALELQLVDSVMTSSQYLLELVEAGDRVLKLHRSSPSRFQRRINVSPLDILPHLRRSLLLTATHLQKEKLYSWLVQGVSYLGFLHHIYTSYWR